MSTIHPTSLPAKSRKEHYRQSDPTAKIAEGRADHVERVFPVQEERISYDMLELRALEATNHYLSSLGLRHKKSEMAAIHLLLFPEKKTKQSLDRLALAELGELLPLALLPDILIVYDSSGRANLQPRQNLTFVKMAPQIIHNEPKEPFLPEDQLKYKVSQFLAYFGTRDIAGALELKRGLDKNGNTIQVGEEEIPREAFEKALQQRLALLKAFLK